MHLETFAGLPTDHLVIPFGKGRVALSANNDQNNRITVVCYGMGVHWALNAAQKFEGQVEIIDLRTLFPLDTELIFKSVRYLPNVIWSLVNCP